MGWEGWARPMFLTETKNHPCPLEFFSIGFFQNFVFERRGLEEFRPFELHVFRGIF